MKALVRLRLKSPLTVSGHLRNEQSQVRNVSRDQFSNGYFIFFEEVLLPQLPSLAIHDKYPAIDQPTGFDATAHVGSPDTRCTERQLC